MASLIPSLVIIVLAIGMSGVFSGAETGLYQMSRLRLRLAVEKNDALAHLLTKCLHDQSGLLVALLVGNNLTIQLVTSTVTVLVMEQVDGSAAEWITTAITTPVLFVFAELLPKNLFLYRADVLMLAIAPAVFMAYQLARWTGAIMLLQFLTRGIAKLTGTPMPSKAAETNFRRHEIGVLLKDTQEEGVLSGLQTGIMNRMVVAAMTPVKDVMTRMKRVQSLPIESDRKSLLGFLKEHASTRVLVYEGRNDEIVGRINIYKVLRQQQPFTHLRTFVKPLRSIAHDTPVPDAIELMQREQEKILLVTRKQRPVGIVTMKDLAEEFLGELSTW